MLVVWLRLICKVWAVGCWKSGLRVREVEELALIVVMLRAASLECRASRDLLR